jgi:hypothetical protein
MATPFLPLNISPSVEFREIDNSQVIQTPTGTTVLVAGFSEQGPSEEPTFISSLQEYEEVFGIPTCAATRYSHNAVKQIVTTSPGNVLFTRMPFGSGAGLSYSDEYSALVYPVIGVSAVEKDVCEYYRNIDEENCRVNFPALYDSYFVNPSICYGSANLDCPLNSYDETAGRLYIHDHPVQYNSILTGFKFVVDADDTAEQLRVFQLRPSTTEGVTTYTIITSINLSGVYATTDEDQTGLTNDGKRLVVDLTDSIYASEFDVTAGILSGQTLSGIAVSAGDIFGTYSSDAVLKYFNASSDVAGTYNTGLTTLAQLSAGRTFTAYASAVDAVTQDFLVSFCTIPVEAGLSCQAITALGLKVPEEDRYDFYPLDGQAQLNDANFYVLGEPIVQQLNESEYELLENGQFNWRCGVFENVDAALDIPNNNVRAGIVVVNDLKSAQLEDFTGYYLAINDNLNVNPSTDFNAITGVAGYYDAICPGVSGEWVDVPNERWNFNVSSTFKGTTGSISEIVESAAPVNFGSKNYNDSLIVSLFRLKPSRLTETINKLDATLVEKYTGSLNKDKKIQDSFGGPPRSGFLEDSINTSRRIKVFVNPYLSENNCWTDNTGTPQKTVRMYREKTATVFDNFDAEATLRAFSDKLYGVGEYKGYCRDALYELCQKKDIGHLPTKLERALMGVENPLDFPIDIVVDAGLSTIWATRQAVTTDGCITDPSICYHFDDTYFVDTDSLIPFNGIDMASNLEQAWTTISNILVNFGRYTRIQAGDAGALVKLDPLRQLFVNGKDYKVVNRQKQFKIDPATGQPVDKYSTFARNIYTPLKNLVQNIDSSYASTEANWIKTYDSSSDSYGWYGPSAFVAAKECRKDGAAFPWTGGLGIQYGGLSNIIDLAINPNQKERELLARINTNPIIKLPEGYILWGSRTLMKNPSALNQEYIRRGMLWLEKALIEISRKYIGQPNNITTRTRCKNEHTTILQYIKDNNGLYDYLVKCDKSNNTPEFIDMGILNIADYVSWVRNIEHVLITLELTKTGANLSEYAA